MKLTKRILIRIIDDELKSLIDETEINVQKRNKKKENERQRKDRLFSGYDEFKKLSLGITEQELDEMIDAEIDEIKKRKTNKGCVGNPFRDDLGKFTDPEDEPYGSWINMKPGCEKRGKLKRRGRKEMFTKLPCGRNEPYRCKDGTEKEYYE